MSAFQDFGPLSERRRAERQQKRRKRLMIAGASVSVVLIVAAVGAAAVLYNKPKQDSDSSKPSKSHGGSSSSSASANAKDYHANSAIQALCEATDHQSACESSLKKYIKPNSQPKELFRAAVTAVVDEVDKAFERTDSIKTDDPSVKAAIDDCRELHGYAVDDLNNTLGAINAHNLNQLQKQVHDLKIWLSAVAAYQQTCNDGFPEGELRTKMQTTMDSAKNLTSNALVIVGEVSSLISALNIAGVGAHRGLLEEEGEEPATSSFHEDGIPSWVSEQDRRTLLSRAANGLTPNVTVAKDGSGNFTTISDALKNMPKKYDGRYVIYVKEGTYQEQVLVDKNMINVTMYGDGSRKTIVTGSKNYVDGVKTFQTATFAVVGDGFLAVAMGFQNTAGAAKHQAVALRVSSDRSIFLNCRMEAYQDTLYAHAHRQFYRGCVILGTVDFIFGDAAAVFQNCILTVRRPLDNQQNIVLAQGRAIPYETSGFVVHNCRIVPDADLAPATAAIRSYLGRPWKEFSHTAIIESDIDGFIDPDGYMPWSGDFGLKTLTYTEYGNKGAGAGTSKRVNWPGFKVITKEAAKTYTPADFLQAGEWIPKTNTPVRMGLYG
ncbi:pectinesterase-like [Canna indica]|uniref:Pectinesterase n=1 Tax=Canna indica TaxID=4628 RepID=A0AAQ3QBE1_9LILI|nr:pectinesterase-like [Canna indica]